MTMKTLQVSLLVLLAVPFLISAMDTEGKDPWTLRIVPTWSSPERGAIINCATKESYFYVVLTNTSQSDMSVWREWCSWGYFCLSFEITLPDGKTFHVKKRPREQPVAPVAHNPPVVSGPRGRRHPGLCGADQVLYGKQRTIGEITRGAGGVEGSGQRWPALYARDSRQRVRD